MLKKFTLLHSLLLCLLPILNWGQSSNHGGETISTVSQSSIPKPRIFQVVKRLVVNYSDWPDESTRKLRLMENKLYPALQTLTLNANQSIASNAAELLGRLKCPNAFVRLTRMLSLPPKNIGRMGAIKGLGMLGDRRATSLLIPLLLKDVASFFGGWQSAEAARALGKLRDSNAVDQLVLVLERVKNPQHPAVWEAIQALGRIGDRRAIDPLIHILQHPFRRRINGHPLAIVRNLNNSSFRVSEFSGSIASPDAEASLILSALVTIGHASRLPLEITLSGQDNRARCLAAIGLGYLGGAGVLELLQKHENDESELVRSGVREGIRLLTIAKRK